MDKLHATRRGNIFRPLANIDYLDPRLLADIGQPQTTEDWLRIIFSDGEIENQIKQLERALEVAGRDLATDTTDAVSEVGIQNDKPFSELTNEEKQALAIELLHARIDAKVKDEESRWTPEATRDLEAAGIRDTAGFIRSVGVKRLASELYGDRELGGIHGLTGSAFIE